MRDFYPDEMAVRNAIFDAWTMSARRFGFEQYDACVVESLDLLKRKGGEEIADQLYAFKDKSDRDLALRAEMTPTLARMIVAKENELVFPLKWFTIAQCFRYERMSRGRKREHYQWNLDIIGETSVAAEVEIVATALFALEQLGLGSKDIRVHFNSRALLSDLLAKLGIPREHHAATFLALDKRGKLPDQEIAKLLSENGLPSTHIEAAFQVMNITSLDDAVGTLGEPTPSVEQLRLFGKLLKAYHLEDRMIFDISVIRGLGYYTGIVFEGFDTSRSFRAIFGGGRYDNLLGDLGGKPATAVGLGFGDVVVAELLADRNKLPPTTAYRDVAVSFMDEGQRGSALAVAHTMRNEGVSVELSLRPEKPKNFFSRVAKSGFRRAIYLGPDDISKGTLRIKSLADRSEVESPLPGSAL
jgi:histidyl-tRNA synthetase